MLWISPILIYDRCRYHISHHSQRIDDKFSPKNHHKNSDTHLKNSRSSENSSENASSRRLYAHTHSFATYHSARDRMQTTSCRTHGRAEFFIRLDEECDGIQTNTRAFTSNILVLSLQLFQQSDRHFQFHYTHDVCGDSKIVEIIRRIWLQNRVKS